MLTWKKILKRILNLSLKLKLTVLFSILVGLNSIFIYVLFPAKLKLQEIKASKTKAESILEIASLSISSAVYFEDLASLNEALEGVKQNRDLEYIVVANSAGQIIYAYNETLAKKSDYMSKKGNLAISKDEEVLLSKKTIIFNKRDIGELYIGFSLKELNREFLQNRINIAVVSFLLFLGGIFLVFSISTIVTQPLRKIVDTVENITNGNLSRRAEVISEDEVGNLAKSFNVMVDRLQSAYIDLENLNKDLEHRVEERTRELGKEIEARKRTEEWLRASEELNRGIVANAPLGILYLDYDGTILYENPAMRKIMVVPEGVDSPVVGLHMQEIPNIKEAGGDILIEKLLQGETVKTAELEYKSIFGLKRALLVRGAPRFNAEGKVIGAVLMCADVTELKELEKQLRQAQKMEAIGTLAGGVAHDFNNILTGILGNVELALLTMELDDEVKAVFRRIQKSSERAAELTARLLAFGRRRMELPKPTDVNVCIDEALQLMRRTINPLIEIRLEKAPDLSIIQADAGQINQILMNLLLNSCDAMPNGGTITIRSENVSIEEEYCRLKGEAVPGKYVKLSVSDNGSGIAPENLNLIFDPFFTTKEVGKGTGLGLSMVYGIVKGHKGWIDVESELGNGTHFSIYLPISKEDEIKEKEILEDFPRGKKETILLVDDEDMVRDLGSEILERFGYKVMLAENGVEAALIYEQKLSEINLVILDLSMPRKSGRETLKDLLRLNPQVKVIVSSGYDKSGPVQQLLEIGAKGFVQKPYKMAEMLNTVRKVLEEK